MKPLISIITPTYNRAHLLTRAYQSLINQTAQNFEWIIVDDGSTDQTKDIVKNFSNHGFNLRFFEKENGGKHTALNFGVQKALGEYILMLDSDDFLPDNATQIIATKTKNLPEDIGGIVGRKADLSYKIVGNQNIKEDLISNSIDIRYQHGVEGDLTEVFKTSVFKDNLFPVFDKEKFVPEILVWNRIAKHHDLLFFNQPIYIADYQNEGLTDKIVTIRMNSPKASMLTYSELANYNIPLLDKIKANINFWRFSFNDKDWTWSKKVKMVQSLLMPFTLPLGYFMHINDKRKNS